MPDCVAITRTIQAYQQKDPATLAKVMLFEAPEAPAMPTNGNAPTEVGATTGTHSAKNHAVEAV